MGIAHRIGIAVMTAALAAGAGVGRAGTPPKQSADPPVDEGLLEFLGSVDPSDPSRDSAQQDDGSWLAYLSQVRIGQGAKASQARPPAQPPARQKPASAADDADKPSG